MKISIVFFIILITSISNTATAKSSHSVKGYVKKTGTYVTPHRATNQDKTQTNNYSTKGNINPYTGKKGTKKAKK